MATPKPLLILLFFSFSILFTTTSSHPKPKPKPGSGPTSYIWASCRATQYPTLCYHTLSPYTNHIHHSPRQLATTALAISLSRARSAARFVTKLKKTKGIRHREMEAVKDCVDTMGDTIDQLNKSIKEMGNTGHRDFRWHMSNVQTWVSAALTNENTCVDGFSGRGMNANLKNSISMRVTNVAQVTSNALALVNRFASAH